MKILGIKLFKYSLIFLVACLVFVLNYLFFAWLLSRISTTPAARKGVADQQIYAASNGVHLDLILPQQLLDPILVEQFNGRVMGRYVAFGWGDKGFYLHTPSWAELKLSTAIKAGFLPSKTVIHVTHYNNAYTNWKPILLSQEELKTIQDFIIASFQQDEGGNFQLLEGAGYQNNDFFYEARGSYTCLYTCNSWVNHALKKAGIQTAIWSPFDKGVLRYL